MRRSDRSRLVATCEQPTDFFDGAGVASSSNLECGRAQKHLSHARRAAAAARFSGSLSVTRIKISSDRINPRLIGDRVELIGDTSIASSRSNLADRERRAGTVNHAQSLKIYGGAEPRIQGSARVPARTARADAARIFRDQWNARDLPRKRRFHEKSVEKRGRRSVGVTFSSTRRALPRRTA